MFKMDNSWINFWSLSAEYANEAIRLGKITSNGKLSIPDDDFFRPTYTYYLSEFKKMDSLMGRQKLNADMTLYRNVFNDIYHELEDDDEFEIRCYTSCFTDNYNSDYGDFPIQVNVKAGTNYLSYDNVIILPPGIFKFVERNEVACVIEFISPEDLFSDSSDDQ